MSKNDAVIVFTARGKDTILAEGGSQAWKLDRANARDCEYLICVQNRHSTWGDGQAEHGSAFLVGRISDVIPSPEEGRGDRWIIQISEYATVNIPNAWKGWRNPVRYMNFDELRKEGIDINPSKLTFEPMPEQDEEAPVKPPGDQGRAKPLTIAEAKRGLAAAFGVGLDAIEITIRA